jgi:hypothetical protein
MDNLYDTVAVDVGVQAKGLGRQPKGKKYNRGVFY